MYDWSNWFRPWYFIWILKTPAFRPNIDIGVWKCKIVVTGSTIDKLLFRKGLQALDTGGKLCCNRPHFLTIARPNLPSVIAVNWPRSSKFSVTEDVRRPLLDRIVSKLIVLVMVIYRVTLVTFVFERSLGISCNYRIEFINVYWSQPSADPIWSLGGKN